MEIDGGFFQIAMTKQDLNGVQIGASFEQVRGEAVTEHMGIHLLFDRARRAAYWQAWRGSYSTFMVKASYDWS